MNTLKKNLLIVIITVIATTSILGLFAFKNKMQEGGKEIVIVTTYTYSTIIINRRNQEPELIDIKGTPRNSVSDANNKLNASFTKLYAEGFHLETTSGGDLYQNYIFVK